MSKNSSESMPILQQTSDFNSSSSQLEKVPLLPRSPWNSQVTYLKVLLQAKQVLDHSRYSHGDVIDVK